MTMIKIGEWNDLIVKREKEFGVYLGCADSDSEVLLPRKQVPNGIKCSYTGIPMTDSLQL